MKQVGMAVGLAAIAMSATSCGSAPAPASGAENATITVPVAVTALDTTRLLAGLRPSCERLGGSFGQIHDGARAELVASSGDVVATTTLQLAVPPSSTPDICVWKSSFAFKPVEPGTLYRARIGDWQSSAEVEWPGSMSPLIIKAR